jgi:hypothetical protein
MTRGGLKTVTNGRGFQDNALSRSHRGGPGEGQGPVRLERGEGGSERQAQGRQSIAKWEYKAVDVYQKNLSEYISKLTQGPNLIKVVWSLSERQYDLELKP